MRPPGALFLSLLLALGPLPSEGNGGLSPESVPGLNLSLKAEACVDGLGIYLRHVADQTSGASLPALRIGDAPKAGQTVMISRQQVLKAIRDSGQASTEPVWSGAEQIRVGRRSREIGETELVALLGSAVQKDLVRDRGELELRLTRPWKPALAPDEPLTVKLVETPAGPLTPTVALTFELWDATECVGRWQTVARLRILREVWVAQTQLPRGRILRTDDFSLERRDLLSSRDPLLEFPAARPVLELAESLASGTVLCSRSLQARPVVRRGDVVEALLVEGSLSISLKVEALDNGAPGQSVRVRNLVSRRELRGKVRDEQTVLVSM